MPVSKAVLAKRIREFDKDEMVAVRALELCNMYHKIKRFRKVKDVHTFMNGRSYPHYIRLSKFITHVHISDPLMYFKAMIKHDKQPGQWTSNYSYRLYLEFMDEKLHPNDAIIATVNELFDLAEIEETEVSELINSMHLTKILLLLRQRRLSPWIVFHSSVIKNKIMKAEEPLQKEFIQMFDMDTWNIKFSKYPDIVKSAKQVVSELHI